MVMDFWFRFLWVELGASYRLSIIHHMLGSNQATRLTNSNGEVAVR